MRYQFPLFLILLLTFACNPGNDKGTTTDKSMLNHTWTLQQINGTDLAADQLSKTPNLTLDVDKNQVSGNDGCNMFAGNIKTVDQRALIFNPLAGTKMACPQMKDSDAINQALTSVQTYQIKDKQLSLYNAGGKEVLTYVR